MSVYVPEVQLYPSSVLMTVVPAYRGVREVVMVTPPQADGSQSLYAGGAGIAV